MNSMRMYGTLADVQMHFARAVFSAANIWSLGNLTPVSRVFEASCDLCTVAINNAEDALMEMSQQSSMDVESMRGVILQRETERQQQPTSMMEREMIARTQPNYSDLRRAANGEDLRLRSILDDDALWVPGQATMSKSAHRYDAGMTRERRIQEQTDYA